jgi:hypothetical protein
VNGIWPKALIETLGFAVLRLRLLAVVVNSVDAGTLSSLIDVSVHAVSKCALRLGGVTGMRGEYFVCLLSTLIAKLGLTTFRVLVIDITEESTDAVPTPSRQKLWR